jgi:hypothetical protein
MPVPSKSKAQQRLMQAAEHGADFPMAKKVRASMTEQQLHEFASGPMAKKPEHVPHPARNLGQHLKTPASGEIVTSHHRKARKG